MDLSSLHVIENVRNSFPVYNVSVHTGHSPVGCRPTGVAHSKIARVVFVLYVIGRAY